MFMFLRGLNQFCFYSDRFRSLTGWSSRTNAILAVQLDPSTLISHVDVRTEARTSAGHYISVRYTGVMKSDDAIAKVLSFAEDAKTTQFGDHETWFTGPVFETSDPDLKWIEDAVWVGRGRCVVDDDEGGRAVEYEVLRVVN